MSYKGWHAVYEVLSDVGRSNIRLPFESAACRLPRVVNTGSEYLQVLMPRLTSIFSRSQKGRLQRQDSTGTYRVERALETISSYVSSVVKPIRAGRQGPKADGMYGSHPSRMLHSRALSHDC